MVKFVSNRHRVRLRSAIAKCGMVSTGPVLLSGRNLVHPVGCGRSCHWKYLHQRRGGWFSGAHGCLMLAARGRVEIDGYAAGDDDRGVVAKVEIACDTVDHGKGGKQDKEGHPTAVEAVPAAGDPKRSHRVALDYGGVAAYSAEGKTEDESAASLPGKIQAPAEPKGTGPQKCD